MVTTTMNGDESTVLGLLMGYLSTLREARCIPEDAPIAASLFLIYVARLSEARSIVDVSWAITCKIPGVTLFADNVFYIGLDPTGTKEPTLTVQD